MAKAALDNLMHDLHRIAGVDALREHSDAELLARFAGHRDEAAFATLVRARYWQIGQRVLVRLSEYGDQRHGYERFVSH